VQRARSIRRNGRLGAGHARGDCGSGRRPGHERGQAEEVRRPLSEIGQSGGQVAFPLRRRTLGGAQELQPGDDGHAAPRARSNVDRRHPAARQQPGQLLVYDELRGQRVLADEQHARDGAVKRVVDQVAPAPHGHGLVPPDAVAPLAQHQASISTRRRHSSLSSWRRTRRPRGDRLARCS
jgi:hypothetical protein